MPWIANAFMYVTLGGKYAVGTTADPCQEPFELETALLVHLFEAMIWKIFAMAMANIGRDSQSI